MSLITLIGFFLITTWLGEGGGRVPLWFMLVCGYAMLWDGLFICALFHIAARFKEKRARDLGPNLSPQDNIYG